MPNFDGGHYFLTVLSPVLIEPVRRADGSITSPTAALRETLASLPTAMESAHCGTTAPFARCHRTHLARFAVIDQPAFNGREAGSTLVEAIRKTDLLVHPPADALPCAWLLLAIDFDAGAGDDHGLRDYLVGLWDLMAAELRAVYRHCHGFADVTDGPGFALYVERCQIETTMSFNDYWTTSPPLPSISLGLVGGIALVSAILGAWGITRALDASIAWSLAILPVTLALALYGAFLFVRARGGRPFPTAPGSDLRTILKAIYLQQQFARFAIAQQGRPDAEIRASFKDFCAAVRPEYLAAPSQAPGVIRS